MSYPLKLVFDLVRCAFSSFIVFCVWDTRVRRSRKVRRKAEELGNEGKSEEALQYLLDNPPEW